MKRVFIFCLFCIGCSLDAQVPASLPVTLITQSTGLSLADNRFLYRDHEGFVWISSAHGLHQYDGSHISLYLPQPDDPTSLKGLIINGYFFEDSWHNIWFSSYEAVNCYVRATNSFLSYTNPGHASAGYFTFGMDRHQQLWMLCGSEVIVFDTRTLDFTPKAQIHPNTIRAEARMDSHGDIDYIIAYSLGRDNPGFQLLDFSSSKLTQTHSFFNSGSTLPLVIRDVCIENDSMIWIASQTGLFSFNRKSARSEKHTPFPGREYMYFTGVEKYNDTSLFVISYGLGAFTFNLRSQTFVEWFQFTSQGVPIDNSPPQAVYVDRDQGIWVSLLDKGVAYFHPEASLFRKYRHLIRTSILASAEMSPNSFVEMEQGRVWAGTKLQGGVILKDAQTIEAYYNRDSVADWRANNTNTSYKDREGRVWVLTVAGPCVIDTSGRLIHPEAPIGIVYNSICESPDGNVVLGSLGRGLFISTAHADHSLSIEQISGTDTTKSYTLLYTHTDGRMYGTADLASWDVLDPMEGFRMVHSLDFHVDANCIVPSPDSASIWIGTNQGLFVYSPASNAFTVPDWLKSLNQLIIYSIVQADERYVWASTNQGLHRLDLKERSFQVYSEETGAYNYLPHAGLLRHNGEVWFGSKDGITVIEPHQTSRFIAPLRINLTHLMINDTLTSDLRCIGTGSSNVNAFRHIRLPYRQNTITLGFTALNYLGPDFNHYEYRMIGISDTWVNNQQRDIVRFANLPPGAYIFEVRATGTYPGSVADVRVLRIDIVAPVYMRPWFIVLAVMFGAGLLFYLYYMYQQRKAHLRQLEFDKRLALEQERLRIANDMHDDLGSGISALNLRTKFLSEHVEGPQLRQQMQELVNQTGKISQQIRETIWTINSRNDTVDSLLTRLHQYALDFFEGSGIHCIVELMPEQNMTPITGAVRREIYLTYKEALHNVLKHARASEVRIRLYTDAAGKLVIDIRDNGQGFDTEKQHDGLGLSSMRKRIEETGGNFELFSDPHGTRITLLYG